MSKHDGELQRRQRLSCKNLLSMVRIAICMRGNQSQVCALCDEKIDEDEICFGDEATEYEGKPLCDTCYHEDEPVASVFYGSDSEVHYISRTRNDTEGDFWVSWHPTDPWRGYYEADSHKYAKILSDAILAYHESEAMLKNLNDRLIQLYDEHHIDFARVFARTSNVFSTGLEFWVQREPATILSAYLLLDKVKQEVKYDDPLYSTGIIMGREELQQLTAFLGNQYQLDSDVDLMHLVEEKGESLIQELADAIQGAGPGGDNAKRGC